VRAGRYQMAWLPRRAPDALRSRRYEIAGGYRRVYYYHLKKTGGTSLARSFLEIGGEQAPTVYDRVMYGHPYAATSGDYVFVFRDVRALERGHYYFGWSHTPAWQLHLPPRTLTVTVLRDPIQRVLSLYRYLLDERADEGLPNGPGGWRRVAEGGFSHFLERLPRHDLLQHLFMFSPRYEPEEAAETIRRCHTYFFLESYAEGVATLSHQLGVSLRMRRDRSSALDFHPTAQELSHLRAVLEPEYELLELLRREPGPSLAGTIPAAGPTAA
jgi:hypothetical protein